MLGQLSFFDVGFRTAVPVGWAARWDGTLDETYFCWRPDETTAARLAAAHEEVSVHHGRRPRLRAAGTYHLSLVGLGRMRGLRRADLAGAIDATTEVRAAPFEIVFDRAVSWPRRDGSAALVLLCSQPTNDALFALGARIGTALMGHAVRSIAPPPNMHLTLSYEPAVLPETPLAEPLRAAVDAFELVRNHHGQARLETLGRYRLMRA